MTEKPPAFQFYPDDWLSSASVTLLTRSQEGDYIRLLCYCWREGSIPNDVTQLAALVGKGATPDEMAQLLNLFEVDKKDSTRLIHSRLNRERKKQKLHRKERSESGAKGARTRWANKLQLENSDGSANGLASGSAIKEPMAKNGSSSPSSSPSPDIENTHTKGVQNLASKFAPPSTEKEAIEWAGAAGVPPDFSKALYHQCEGRGWIDGAGQPIQMWSSYAKGRYLKEALKNPQPRQQGQQQLSDKSPTIFALKAQKEAKLEMAKQIKNRYCSDVAMGEQWSDEDQHRKYRAILKEVNQITERMASCH